MAQPNTSVLIQVITGILLVAWPGVLLASFMLAADAPGERSLGQLLFCASLPLYPMLIGILYPVLGWHILRLPNWFFSPVLIIAPFVAVSFLYGPSLLLKLQGISTEGISVIGDSAYLDGRLMEGVDAKSFVAVCKYYSKDQNHVYSNRSRKIIENADPQSFRVYENRDLGSYSRDKDHVFLNAQAIPSADPETFQPITDVNYNVGHDRHHVFSDYSMIEADPATFTEISQGYFKDKDRVFFYSFGSGLGLVEGAQAGSFSVLDYDWAKDEKHVYAAVGEGRKIRIVALPEADPASFSPLDEHYAKDKAHVYYAVSVIKPDMTLQRNFIVVKDADPSTLKVTGIRTVFDKSDASDKNHTYLKGMMVGESK